MALDLKTRKKLIKIFEDNNCDYRKVVSDRAKVHPNTVSNTLRKGTDNFNVELQLMIYAKEVVEENGDPEEKRKQARAIASQL
jgi:hypothetical protein